MDHLIKPHGGRLTPTLTRAEILLTFKIVLEIPSY